MTRNYKHTGYFFKNGCITQNAIKAYLFEKPEKKLQKEIETHIQKCQMCREAIEGFRQVRNQGLAESSIARIDRRIDQHVFSSGPRNKRMQKITNPVYWMAASILLIVGFYGYVSMRGEKVQPSKAEVEHNQRLLGENVFQVGSVNYFSILGNGNDLLQDKNVPQTTTSELQDINNKTELSEDEERNGISKNSFTKKTSKYLIKNDMIIRDSKTPELLKPINYPFDIFIQKKIDSLLESTQIKYSITAEFVVSREGKVKKPRIVESNNTRVDAFTLKVLQESPDWKPATINDTPVDYPVKIHIRKD